jgi:nicotinate dehydrogenase subunit A
MANVVGLTVNGIVREVECEEETPLIYVLRNNLGLLGTRFGCGLGLCGACNVLVDDIVTRSCVTTVGSVAQRRITTVEGIGTPTAPHRIQESFARRQAFQCGYCSSGMMISGMSLLNRHPGADEATVRSELNGNLCRCGAHNRIVAAILDCVSDQQ